MIGILIVVNKKDPETFSQDARLLKEGIVADINAYNGKRRQHDDMTLVVITRMSRMIQR
ncbi:hypothetical protein GX408_01025 [bacterium]|nr:hypothetical protein [bacterium]